MSDHKYALIIGAFSINSLPTPKKYLTCISTWEYWCKKHNIDLILLDGNKENVVDVVFGKWLDFDLYVDLEKYKGLAMVDWDTIVRWDAPNFIEHFLNQENFQASLTPDQGGSGKWHYDQWLKFDPNLYTYCSQYFNSGVIIAKPEVFKSLKDNMGIYYEFYMTHKGKEFHPVGIGIEGGSRIDAPDQTPVNLIVNKNFKNGLYSSPIEVNYMVPLHSKNFEDPNSYIEKAIVFHYGSGVVNRTKVVENFWEKYKNNYS